MKKLLFVILMAVAISRAEDATGTGDKFIVGFGGGFEAGNGLRVGISRGKHTVELGLGLLYKAQDAEFQYSAGLRYLHTLYAGRINDTYAWTGAGVMGHDRTGSKGHLASAGAGLGISLHFGMPFHLNFDSGWRVYYDTNYDPGSAYSGVRIGPTINGALVYEW